MFENEMAEGVGLLDREQGLDWPYRIDLVRLDMRYGHDGVIGQLYGHLTDRFKPEEGVPYGFDLYLTDNSSKSDIQTQEWKEKISQLRKERR